jgi:hypothetical protein
MVEMVVSVFGESVSSPEEVRTAVMEEKAGT